MVAPLLDYMPGVRKGIVADLPRKRLALSQHRALAHRLRAEGYGQALVMPRTWKSALAPSLAGIPRRTGFVGEGRFGLINDLRFGERRLPRMVDRCAMLALPKGEARAGRMAVAGTQSARVRTRRLASAVRARARRPPSRCAGAGRGRAVQALARCLLRRARAPAGCRGPLDMGDRRTRAKRSLRPRSPTAPISATSPVLTCATPFSRSRRQPSRYRTIPVCCTSRPRSARRPSEFSARPAHGTGLRSIRSPP